MSSQTDLPPKRYRYTSKERDTETGLSYHGARYYAPWLCRWTSADPAGFVDGANLYVYAASNPIRHTDPDGTQLMDQGTANDPVYMGCTAGECYFNARADAIARIRIRQSFATLSAISESPLSTLFWGIERMRTDDPDRLAAAANLGLAPWGVAASVAGAGQLRDYFRNVGPVEPLKPVAAIVEENRPSSSKPIEERSLSFSEPTTASDTSAAASPPRRPTAPPPPPPGGRPPSPPPGSPPPSTPGGSGAAPPPPPPKEPQRVLLIGAESEAEVGFAQHVMRRGGQVVIANPIESPQVTKFVEKGGKYIKGVIEDIPLVVNFNLITEDFPFPEMGFGNTKTFIEERYTRLAPGGTYVMVTESEDFINQVKAVGWADKLNMTIYQTPYGHETARQSEYLQQTLPNSLPRDTKQRFLVMIYKPR